MDKYTGSDKTHCNNIAENSVDNVDKVKYPGTSYSIRPENRRGAESLED